MQIFSFFPLYLADKIQTTYMMKLKDINEEERPRERLFTKGAEALSNAELLAILLRTGYGKKNVLEISHELLHNACDLTGLSSMSNAVRWQAWFSTSFMLTHNWKALLAVPCWWWITTGRAL